MFNISMKTVKEIRLENGRWLMAKIGSQVRFSEKLGKSPNQISSILGKAADPEIKGIGDDLAREIETAFDYERGWMDHDHGLVIGETSREFKVGSELVDIRRMNVEASQGSGRVAPIFEETISNVTMSKSWLHKNLVFTHINNLRLITGIGDSMAKTIMDGDVLIVDTGINEVKLDAVYVFERDSELFIKRIQRLLDGSYMIISDNREAYDPYPISKKDLNSIHLAGRVLIVFNGRKL